MVDSIVDVGAGQLLDVVAGRDSAGPCRWLAARLTTWRANIAWATLDLSGPYRSVFDTMLPDAIQVADPFHVVKLANTKLDECRRRVQNETLGHRGRKDDPLYRCRRLLTKADERLDDRGRTKLLGLLDAGDPRGEVRIAWHAEGGRAHDLRPSPIPTWPSTFVDDGSAAISKTSHARSRSVHSAAHSSDGATRSRRGITPTCRTGRPKPPTTRSSG